MNDAECIFSGNSKMNEKVGQAEDLQEFVAEFHLLVPHQKQADFLFNAKAANRGDGW